LWPKEEKNGIDLIWEIRTKTKIIPIVVISWLDDISRIEQWFEKWANDYIVKPFRLKELEIRVFKWFQMYFYTDLSGKNKVSYKWLEYYVLKNEFYFNWKKIELTRWNKYLLSLFLSRPEILLKESYLTEKIWWDLVNIVDRNLRVNISRLKDSLNPYKLDNWITNIRWEWYMLKKN
jgi:DNA-binding response OmpR family regulator